MASFDLREENSLKNKPKRIKIWGISFIACSTILLVIILTSFLLPLKYFLMGMFGLSIYPISIALLLIGIAFVNNKKYVMPKRYILFLLGTMLSLFAVINIIILGNPQGNLFDYIALTYQYQYTAGGAIVGIVIAPFIKTMGLAGALIVFLSILVVFVALIVDFLNSIKIYGLKEAIKRKKNIEHIEVEKVGAGKTKLNKKQSKPAIAENFNLFVDKKIEEEENRTALVKLGLIEGNMQQARPTVEHKPTIREHLLTPPELDESFFFYGIKNPPENKTKNFETVKDFETEENKFKEEVFDEMEEELEEEPFSPHIEEKNIYHEPIISEQPKVNNNINFSQPTHQKKFADLTVNGDNEPVKMEQRDSNYCYPPIDLLDVHDVDLTSLNEDIVGKRNQLENSLQTFGINAKVIGVVVGPSVTRYEIEMPQGVSVKKIISLQDDISLALASRSAIRIEAPIPGKSAVGIEVPNDSIAMVSIREVLESENFKRNTSPVTFALGKNISGMVELCNLAKMPHILVAGATNSGKSICLNAIIISMIYKSSPDDVRFILVDPKQVEFSLYNGLPHLLVPNVITEVDVAVNAFHWCVNEMERRYELLREARCRNSEDYNKMPEVLSGEAPRMPYIVVIVDELADLMSSNKKELEEHLRRLTQKARAAGILLVLATQRPSVDVITGTIKTNCPARISFSLTSVIDSRTILDCGGAESLLGRGDMLYKPTDAGTPRRVQGCFVSTEEVERIVDYIKDTTPANFDEKIQNAIEKTNNNGYNGQVDVAIGDPNWDPLLPQALKMFIEQKSASTSSIQRRFLTGFPRASRIVDQLCRLGYLSQPDGTKPRDVLITMEEFVEKFGIIDD